MTMTKAQLEVQIRALENQSMLTAVEERRLAGLTRDLSSLIGHPVSVKRGGQAVCISVDATPRSKAAVSSSPARQAVRHRKRRRRPRVGPCPSCVSAGTRSKTPML